MAKQDLTWTKKPEAEDYEAALDFLSLIYPTSQAKHFVAALRKAPSEERVAKDLLRASAMPLLPRDEPKVDEELKRIRKGKALSPVLLIQGDAGRRIPLIVADGYHRVCAICYYDENAPIPCRMTSQRAQ